ncbi:MAG: hypothetical protein J6R77_04420 [Clostridia bacterium]|nr:hypothetical protein [Clostridia bacterium]
MASYRCEHCDRVFDLDEVHGGVCPSCGTPVALTHEENATVTDPQKQEEIYQKAAELANRATGFGDWEKAGKLFLSIAGYKNADELATACQEKAEEANKEAIYLQAKNRQSHTAEGLRNRAALMRSIAGYKDADELAAAYQAEADALAAEADRTREVKEAAQQVEKQAMNKKTRRKRKFVIAGAGLALVLIAAVLVVSLVIIPAQQYEKAVKTFETGDLAAANTLFAEIPNYKDSGEYLKKISYQLGVDAIAQGQYITAVEYLEKAGQSADALTQLAVAQEALYEEGIKCLNNGEFLTAQTNFDAAGSYEDAKKYKQFCRVMRVWNGDDEEAKKMDLTKADDIVWKVMDGVWWSDDSEQELTIDINTKSGDAPDLTIQKDRLQWTMDGVTYTIQMTDLFTFTLTGNGPWAGTYYKV